MDLRDSSVKYNIMENQGYALVKALKDFRVYVLHSHVISYVPNVVMKDILTQTALEVRTRRWITVIIEDLAEIKPTMLIKDQGFAK